MLTGFYIEAPDIDRFVRVMAAGFSLSLFMIHRAIRRSQGDISSTFFI